MRWSTWRPPVIGGVSAAIVLLGLVALASDARAAFVDLPSSGDGTLVLSADPHPADFPDIGPGAPAYWQITARLERAERASLSIEYRTSGELARHRHGLILTIDECAEPWRDVPDAPSCATGARRVAVSTPAEDTSESSPTFELAPVSPGRPDHLLLTLAVADTAAATADTSLMGLTASVGVALTAAEIDGVPVEPGRRLPSTGVDAGVLLALTAVAAGLIGVGAAVRGVRSERTRDGS